MKNSSPFVRAIISSPIIFGLLGSLVYATLSYLTVCFKLPPSGFAVMFVLGALTQAFFPFVFSGLAFDFVFPTVAKKLFLSHAAPVRAAFIGSACALVTMITWVLFFRGGIHLNASFLFYLFVTPISGALCGFVSSQVKRGRNAAQG